MILQSCNQKNQVDYLADSHGDRRTALIHINSPQRDGNFISALVVAAAALAATSEFLSIPRKGTETILAVQLHERLRHC
jgi:hypothetical protein